MNKRKLILDVDTGSDDALAILAALKSPEFEVVGICTVGGNLPIENTTENTLRVVELAGCDVPVIRGAHEPLVARIDPLRALRKRAERGIDENGREVAVHSDYLPLPPSTRKPLEKTNAVCWYIDTLTNADEPITVVLTGPMTNFALAVRSEPQILENVCELVIMGGGHTERNSTIASEFNVFTDPEAAAVVLNCGAKITLMPLDATHRACLRPRHIEYFRSLHTPTGDFIADEIERRIEFYNAKQPLHEPDLAPIHDALCLVWLLDEKVIAVKRHMRCDVVCGGIADGQTLFDTRFYCDMPRNVHLCLETDEALFEDLLVRVLSR